MDNGLWLVGEVGGVTQGAQPRNGGAAPWYVDVSVAPGIVQPHSVRLESDALVGPVQQVRGGRAAFRVFARSFTDSKDVLYTASDVLPVAAPAANGARPEATQAKAS